jgi:hypothetical protein
MATLMLSDDVLGRLPDDVRPYAAGVLAARRAGEDSGRMIGIPRSASGERSFHSVALGYFDVLVRTYDEVLYLIIAPTREPNESWIAFNRRLMRFSLAVVRAAPDRYASWVVGALTRTLGQSVVTNLPAMLAILAVLFAWCSRLIFKRQFEVRAASPVDFPALAVLAGVWFVSAGLLTMLVIAPVKRYIDTSSILLAPIFIYGAARQLVSRLPGSPGDSRTGCWSAPS